MNQGVGQLDLVWERFEIGDDVVISQKSYLCVDTHAIMGTY